ncbi:MAG TPA: HlyD family secretion protein [Bacteroidia bacterium]|nr:HlyD family secretion protein [Bacteroidia bacterium]
MNKTAKKKTPVKLIVIGVLAMVAVVAGVMYIVNSSGFETSDNAQLDGDLVPIRSGITANITGIKFNDNQAVKKGDTLLVFDSDEAKARVMQAEAALENAKANLLSVENKAQASTENASASTETAQSDQQNIVAAKVRLEKAQKDFSRTAELQKIKAATQEQLDNADAALALAKSDYSKALNQEESSNSSSLSLHAQAKSEQNQIDLAKAQIKQREAELTLARKQLSYATVLAPCNGIVTKRAVQQGQYVSAGQSLCVVINNEHFWISANFKETQLEKIKIGNVVNIKLDAFPDLKLSGKVESYSGATGAKFSLLPPDNATGNFIKITQRFPLRISIDNFPAEKGSSLFPGLSAFVKITTK